MEARREREVTIGEVLPSLLLLAGLLQVVGDAILCEAEAAASKRGSELIRRRLRSIVLVARDVQPGLCAAAASATDPLQIRGATY